MRFPGPRETGHFGVRLRRAMDVHGRLCVGLDPHRSLIESWGLAYDLAGLERFTMTCVEAFAGSVAIVKPQSAFFEVFGSRGIAVLERAINDLRSAHTLTLLDAKRGDIGSTMAAYAHAFIGPDAVAPVDAVTISPYLGYESLRPAIDLARANGRGVFVLDLTSNPEGRTVQQARYEGRAVASEIADAAAADNAEAAERGELGHVGLVIGATVGSAVRDLDLDLRATPILAPGFGAQGGDRVAIDAVFGSARGHVLASSSRDILAAGPSVVGLSTRMRQVAETLA